MSKDDRKRPEDNVKSRRELLEATAKLSAFFGAMGLAGATLAGEAAADTKGKVFPKVETKRNLRMLPAVQQRELKGLLNDAMRTGDAQTAMKRHPNLKLNPRQRQALMRMNKQDWAALRSAQAKLRPLQDLAAGDTGYVFW